MLMTTPSQLRNCHTVKPHEAVHTNCGILSLTPGKRPSAAAASPASTPSHPGPLPPAPGHTLHPSQVRRLTDQRLNVEEEHMRVRIGGGWCGDPAPSESRHAACRARSDPDCPMCSVAAASLAVGTGEGGGRGLVRWGEVRGRGGFLEISGGLPAYNALLQRSCIKRRRECEWQNPPLTKHSRRPNSGQRGSRMSPSRVQRQPHPATKPHD